MSQAIPSSENRAQLRHIIGIERWGQRRLAAILGAQHADDEYDDYQSNAALEWLALRQELAQTRRETIALGRQIAARGIGDDVTAYHNGTRLLNAREWLQYLNTHSRAEAFHIR